MRLKPKQDRASIMVQVSSLISEDNEIRFIDLFVEKIDINSLEIKYKTAKKEGKDLGGPPEYDPKDFLRLYIYGYLNRVRSSRSLERECRLNAELIWLMSGQTPKHNVINEFRKDNAEALLKVFWLFNEFWRDLGLFGQAQLDEQQASPVIGEQSEGAQSEDSSLDFAIDGSKFRGQNSKANNYNDKKVEKNLSNWHKKAAEYLAELAQEDGQQLANQPEDKTILTPTELKKK